MKHVKVRADQLHCPSCGTKLINNGCPNPNCPAKKPIKG